MTDTPKITAARIEVVRARTALVETARELQARLEPKTLANEAWEKAKNKGADLAEEAVDAVKKRPVAVGGVIAALTMFLAREPIKDAAVKFYDAMTSTDEPKPDAPALKPTDKPPPVRRRARKAPRTAPKKEKIS
ncbi:MAG: DUF3618 domain-containing protein [Sphingomicrobium sp.]